MMFGAIARVSIRFRWLVVALWIAIPVLAGHALPSLSSVTQTSNSQFLSASDPSQQAAVLAVPFQGRNASSTAVIVASRPGGRLTAADGAAIGRLEHLAAAVPGVTLVRDQGSSADGRARRTLVVTSVSTSSNAAAGLVADVRGDFAAAQPPAGLGFHLTGPLAQSVDAQAASSRNGSNILKFTLLFVIVLLFVVFRSVLAPLITLVPAVLSLILAGPLIGQASRAGLPVSTATGQLLTVLLIGAGTDYGLFLVFRAREEIRRGAMPRDAVIAAMSRVGQSITFSAATVIAALASLLLASFGLYRGIGPALAIGIGVVLAAALTLLPALLAIFGRAVFWPSRPAAGQQTTSGWGRVAARVVRHPVPTLTAGIVLFGALSAGLAGYRVVGFASSSPATASDSAAGTAVLAAHFPAASSSPDSMLLRLAAPAWDDPAALARAQSRLAAATVLHGVTGPLDPNGTPLTAGQLTGLHARLGPPGTLPASPHGSAVPARIYQAYRATAQFISPDGRTVQFSALPAAGPAGSPAATDSVPAMRAALAAAARATGARRYGIAGQDAASYDVYHSATSDLRNVLPIVLVIIAALLVILLRSLIAPWYLIATVGLSYLASLGFAMIVFVHLGGDAGLNFIIPFLLFIFAMALGEDYNILLMSRIREEAHASNPSGGTAGGVPLSDALTRAIGLTGGTITSAGLILGGTFTVLGIAGGNDQARQLGFTIAFAVFLDTFFVRTLLVPSAAALLGRWNWWPSRLSRHQASTPSPADRATTAAPGPRGAPPSGGPRSR
jgi:putative drug exporter of the RND superfamily